MDRAELIVKIAAVTRAVMLSTKIDALGLRGSTGAHKAEDKAVRELFRFVFDHNPTDEELAAMLPT